jgi:hypothetical protein
MARSNLPFPGRLMALFQRITGRGAVAALTARLTPATRVVRPAWRMLTPAGRAALLVAGAAWILGVRLGWQELFLVAACCAIALLIAVGFVIGRPSLDIAI